MQTSSFGYFIDFRIPIHNEESFLKKGVISERNTC